MYVGLSVQNMLLADERTQRSVPNATERATCSIQGVGQAETSRCHHWPSGHLRQAQTRRMLSVPNMLPAHDRTRNGACQTQRSVPNAACEAVGKQKVVVKEIIAAELVIRGH